MSDYLRRLEEELVRAGYDSSVRARVRRSPARPALAATLVCAVLVGVVVVIAASLAGGGTREMPARPPAAISANVSVSPRVGGRHTAFTVTFTAPRATGDVGRRTRSYVVAVHRVKPRAGCIQAQIASVPAASDRPSVAAGQRVSARVAPQGEGSPAGWCPGRFRGTVTDVARFACPGEGACVKPRDVRPVREPIGRFGFRVR